MAKSIYGAKTKSFTKAALKGRGKSKPKRKTKKGR